MKRNTLDWRLSPRLINAEGVLTYVNNRNENNCSRNWICRLSKRHMLC